MNYCVKNDLSLFDFHDADLSFVSYDGTDLCISAKHMNIHKHTPQNPADFNQEIDTAQITFHDLSGIAYDPGRIWKTGEDGISRPVGPVIIYSGEEAMDKLLDDLQVRVSLSFLECENSFDISFGGFSDIEPWLGIDFHCSCITVCWENYKKKAWYELHKQFQYNAMLKTPDGSKEVTLVVTCSEEPVYIQGKLVEAPFVSVDCTLNGAHYFGYGKDSLWIDAFADLQNQLPAGCFLKCCLTCRHGNLCPTGNNANEVFCTKGRQWHLNSVCSVYHKREH